MRGTVLKAVAVAAALATTGWTPMQQSPVLLGQAPGLALQSIGPLTFAPDGTLFAADRSAATIYALQLGDNAAGGAPGAVDVCAIDQKIAALLGTDVKEIIVTDLAVHPKTRNAYIAVMRGTGTDAKPALVRVDGAGKLTVAPDGTLFAADRSAATIYALELGDKATGGAPGAVDVGAIDQKIAALLGTDAAAISVTDLAVHPSTKNAFIAVMRGQGADAKPALVRVDGNGKLEAIDLASLKSTRAALPNAPAATTGRRNPRADSITDMTFVNGRLIVAGLSNEEFASKLRTIAYPFAQVDPGTSVEIYHGNHGQLETRSPVYAFVPYNVGGTPHLIAGYLCTPLVKFPVASLTGTQKVVGTTIAELGAGNRPIDMIVYKKDGREYLLMSNTNRGVMKIPTAGFADAAPITSRIGGTAGIGYETIASMTGIEQMDMLDAQRSIVLARASGALNLQAVPLP